VEEPPIAVSARTDARPAAGERARTRGRGRLLLAVEHRAASLAAARALRASGFEVWVATPHARTYAALSRAVAGRIRVPDPSADPAAFVEALVTAAEDLDVVAVLPAGEPAALALAGRTDEFPPETAVGAVSSPIVERATDKLALLELAAAAGLAVPESMRANRRQLEQGAQTIHFPALLKPRWSETRVGAAGLEYVMARRVRSQDELRTKLERLPGDEWIIQRHVRGRLGAICGVAWEGRLICAVHQVALRTYPDDGPSAYAVTVAPDLRLQEKVARLLELMNWSGIFQAQFIHSGSERYLIDFNPRTYGSLALAVAAGMNLPAIWVELLLGREPLIRGYRLGVGYRSEERDIRAMLTALVHGRPAAASKVLIPRRGTVHAVFSLRDPLPILTSIGKLAGVAWQGGRRQTATNDR
jgi:predicted ATP-grasp superfamily ATP-dependent carboligase